MQFFGQSPNFMTLSLLSVKVIIVAAAASSSVAMCTYFLARRWKNSWRVFFLFLSFCFVFFVFFNLSHQISGIPMAPDPPLAKKKSQGIHKTFQNLFSWLSLLHFWACGTRNFNYLFTDGQSLYFFFVFILIFWLKTFRMATREEGASDFWQGQSIRNWK